MSLSKQQITALCSDFNTNLGQLLIFAKSKVPQLQRTFDQFTIAKQNTPSLLIEKMAPKIVPYGEQISNRNEEFFMTFDYEILISGPKADESRAIIEKVRECFGNLTNSEKNKVWRIIENLYLASFEFIKNQ